MTDKVQKIREEVERIQLYTQSEVLKQVLDYIDEVRKEPVSDIWHDASEPPIIDKTFLLVAPNGNSSLCLWGGKELHSVTIGGGYSVLCKGDIYSYIDDLLNLDNSCNSGKNLQEEPVSEKKCMFTKENYTDEDRKVLCEGCKEKCEYSKKKEYVSDDLGEYINELSKQFPEVSFAKLSRIAVRVTKWQKEHLWKPADGDDLPEIDREVVVFTQNFPNDAGIMSVSIAHRPNPNGWDGKSLSTGKIEHYTPKTYDKGGWNIPDIVYWLDVKLPKEIEL